MRMEIGDRLFLGEDEVLILRFNEDRTKVLVGGTDTRLRQWVSPRELTGDPGPPPEVQDPGDTPEVEGDGDQEGGDASGSGDPSGKYAAAWGDTLDPFSKKAVSTHGLDPKSVLRIASGDDPEVESLEDLDGVGGATAAKLIKAAKERLDVAEGDG